MVDCYACRPVCHESECSSRGPCHSADYNRPQDKQTSSKSVQESASGARFARSGSFGYCDKGTAVKCRGAFAASSHAPAAVATRWGPPRRRHRQWEAPGHSYFASEGLHRAGLLGAHLLQVVRRYCASSHTSVDETVQDFSERIGQIRCPQQRPIKASLATLDHRQPPTVSSRSCSEDQSGGRPLEPIQQRKRCPIRQVVLTQHEIESHLREQSASVLKGFGKLAVASSVAQPPPQRCRSCCGIAGQKNRRVCTSHCDSSLNELANLVVVSWKLSAVRDAIAWRIARGRSPRIGGYAM